MGLKTEAWLSDWTTVAAFLDRMFGKLNTPKYLFYSIALFFFLNSKCCIALPIVSTQSFSKPVFTVFVNASWISPADREEEDGWASETSASSFRQHFGTQRRWQREGQLLRCDPAQVCLPGAHLEGSVFPEVSSRGRCWVPAGLGMLSS